MFLGKLLRNCLPVLCCALSGHQRWILNQGFNCPLTVEVFVDVSDFNQQSCCCPSRGWGALLVIKLLVEGAVEHCPISL